MVKKVLAFALLGLLVSCGTSKTSRIQTTKNGTAKTKSYKKTRGSSKTQPSKTATASTENKSDNRTTEVLESTSKTVVYSDLVKQYVLDYKDTAKNNMKNHGVPASITLAQGILESGAGKGTLAVSANNHFGIKCHKDWTGDSVYHDDDSEQECFRKYNDPAESYNDHSLFLTSRSRYASLFELDKDDYAGWAKGLKACGYATDPKYPDKLIGLIERYELAKYDEEVLEGKSSPAVVKAEPKKEEPKPVAVQTTAPAPKPEPVVVKAEPVVVKTEPTPQIGVSPGAVGTYQVQQGDTLYSISKKNNTTVDELIRINGLNGNAISIGQVLKVK
jgi:flagellum-specific peptidoglycan hydrolase FlgJ